MAAYFHGSTEMQGNGGDALQTLFLMNPAYVGYSDNQQHQLPPPPSAASFIPHGGGGGGGSIPGFNYNNLYNPLEVTRAKQGLSLSLSSQQPSGAAAAEEVRVFGGAPENVGRSCKYLKVAQQLLDEVVSIGKEASSGRGLSKEENGQAKNGGGESSAAEEGGDGGAKSGAELNTAEKQEIQMKKAKLVDMLNEVEQRYKQYEQQMQMVIGWFEQAAGVGSAKTYTALALQTISKQFRCLKDAITAQIRAAGRRLGEDEGGKIEVSRLKYIDIQQRALHQQQFGMIQNNAWRPQRGLPERSVSVLRAWLFEHFLHPYPKDSDKIMLAKQAGLTRSQVSNWFINARVRLWKPMVEEMYAEEMKAQQQNASSEEDWQHKSDDKQASTSQEIHNNINTNSPTVNNNNNNNNNNNAGLFNLIGSPKTDITTHGRRTTPKKPRNNADVASHSPPMIKQHDTSDHTKYGYERESREGFTITGAPASFFGIGTYPMMGMEQFQAPYSSNGSVSLTLGLHHRRAESEQEEENNNDFGSLNYDSIQVQNSKRLAAQLMPDFVT